jgi:heme a synthase
MNEASESVSWLHRFAALVACSTFGLIVAGALVTSMGAGLSVPDWPTAFGSFHFPHMVHGVQFEFTHRLIAGSVGLLTVALAVWLSFSKSPRYVKRLGWIAVLAVVAQAVLGGVGVLLDLPVAVTVSHACLAEIFFLLVFSLALFTRTDWRWDVPKTPDVSSPSLRSLAVVTAAAIFVQVVLGALFRYNEFGIAPHIVGGVVVMILVLYVLETALNKFSGVAGLKIAAVLLAVVTGLQFFLGLVAFSMKLNALKATEPMPGMAVMTATHAAVGALVTACALFMVYQAFKYVAPRESGVGVRAASREMTA